MLFSILMLLSCGKLISSPIKYISSDNSVINIFLEDGTKYNCTPGSFDLSQDSPKASINLSNCKLVKDKRRSTYRPSHYNADGVPMLYNVKIDSSDNTQVTLSFEGKNELTLKCPVDVSEFVDQYKPVTAQMPNIMTDIYPNSDIRLTLTSGGKDGKKFVARETFTCCLGCGEQEVRPHEIQSGYKPVRNKDGKIIGFAPYGVFE